MFEEVRGQWEEHFEGRYGFWRGFVDEQVRRYMDRGLFENGFARVRCSSCATRRAAAPAAPGIGVRGALNLDDLCRPSVPIDSGGRSKRTRLFCSPRRLPSTVLAWSRT